jgi:dTDP-4-dehydrorhamnose 3,5-epimerase
MKLRETSLAGVLIIEPRVQRDIRGSFSTHFAAEWFGDHGLETSFVQACASRNDTAGTLRGMHWQCAPHEEVKLVRCIRGAVYDVVLDLRKDSPTFRRWCAVELTEQNELAIYVPRGCAHGYQTLLAETWVSYLLSGNHVPMSARGVRWNDPLFAIEWPTYLDRVISERDATYPDYGSDE